MTEVIRYSRMGEEEINFGLATFEVRLADGRVVVLSQVDLGALLSDAAKSTRILSLDSISLALGQITFPATQNRSSDLNTLDDYRERPWTPSVGGSATYTTQEGYYVKVGDKVTAWCNLAVNVIGTGDTNVISGLPYICDGPPAIGAVQFVNLSAAKVSLVGRVGLSSNQIVLYSTAAAATSMTAAAVIGSGTELTTTISYISHQG